MPLKLNLGLSKKIGLPNYGSLGASCHVEVELEHGLLDSDPQGFQDRVRRVYISCRQAVQEELARHLEPERATASNSYGPATLSLGEGGNGTDGSADTPASHKQTEYARQLAYQIRGLGVRRLEMLVQKMHDKPLAELTSPEASALIALLRDLKTGKVEIDAAFEAAAA